MEQTGFTIYSKEVPKVHSKLCKPKKSFGPYIVVICIVAILLYTAICFILQFVAGIEPSPTLTTAFFAFFGGELFSLALIKRAKVKHNGTTTSLTTREVSQTKQENPIEDEG